MLRQNIKVFILFLVVVVFFILIKNGGIFDLGIVFRSWLAPDKPINSLFNPPNELEQAYKDLLVENNRLKALTEENQQLKKLLELKKEKQFNLVVSNIISRDPVNRNILIIDAGLDQDIEKGQAVVVDNGIIIGKIIDVSTDSAKIRLLTDKFTKLAVNVGNQAQISGLLSGSLGLVMDLSYVPQDQDIRKDDLVVTADLDVDIPAGLVVGRVEAVEFSEGEVFKQATVSPLVDYDTLAIVAVITS